MSTADRVLSALEKFGLKSEGTGKYRCNSPLRPGSDSMSFTVKVDGAEHGGYYDHRSGEKGSLYDLARALNIPLPMVTPVASTKRSYEGLSDYARAHGLPPEKLMDWHWREVTYQNRPALEFPTKTGKRWRFIDGDTKKPVYSSERGYARCWYGLSKTVLYRLDDRLPLIVCNGEISTITAQHYGMAAIAMTSGEKAEIPADLMAQLKGELIHNPKVRIIIAMDCDTTGRKAAIGLLRQFQDEGFNVRAVDLGLDNGGDLADFCMLYQGDSVSRIESLPDLQVETSGHDHEFNFYSIDDLMKLPPLQWLVPGIIPARGLCMVYGPSGVGKSFYTLGMAFQLAFKHGVIYVVAEGESGMSERVLALIKHHNSQPPHLTFMLGQVNLFDDQELTVFKGMAKQYSPRLIVVDTLAMCTGDADENSARDMKVIVDGCKRMARELDSAIMLVHHTNKEGRQARGSGRLYNDADTVIRLTRMDDMIAVESQKSKDRERFKTHYLREVRIDLGYTDHEKKPVSSLVLLPAEKVKAGAGLTELQIKILESISIEPNASFNDIAFMCEVTRSTISSAVSRLTKSGYLMAYDGNARRLTEAGMKAIGGDSSDSSDSSDSGDSPDSRTSENQETTNHHESRESANQRITSRRQKRMIEATAKPNHHYTEGL